MNPNVQDAAYVSLVNEGANLFEAGEHKAALVVYWKAFRLNPGSPVLLFNLARTMSVLSDPRAEDFYAAAASQGHNDAFYQLATLCVSSGRSEEAVRYLRVYLKGNPAEDDCTQWARQMLQRLSPGKLALVWRNPEFQQKLSQKGSQKQVGFGIL
jgi:tetratricopeptide (TPR) repeat protein